jgi:chlorobactene glucosyltransferase
VWKRRLAIKRPSTVDIYHGLVLAAAVTNAAVLGANLRALRRFRLDAFHASPRPAESWPLVSVLVPARNEAATIEHCVRSLLAQDYPNIEILVLDDGSTDGTYEIVERLRREDSAGRLRVLHGKDLPPGWMGKCHACQQLADHARGDYLLFIDADTEHATQAVSAAVGAVEELGAAFITAQPRQMAVTLGERLFQPLLTYDVLTLLPVELVGRIAAPIVSAGSGQFMLFRRGAYDEIGGHAAIRAEVLEDMEIVRVVKAKGYRAMWLDAGTAVRCRMYRSFGQLWQGYSKNFYACYGANPGVAALMLGAWAAINMMPPVLVGVGLARRAPRSQVILPALTWGLTTAMRLALAKRVRAQRSDWYSAFLHPVAAILQVALTVNSARWSLTGRTSWKGRVYPSHPSAGRKPRAGSKPRTGAPAR